MTTELTCPENEIGQISNFLPQQSINRLISNLKSGFEIYLSSFINDCVQRAIEEHSLATTPEEDSEIYLTTKEACKLLKISSTTLWRWTEDGRITKHYVYGSPRYLKAEVLSKIKSITPKI